MKKLTPVHSPGVRGKDDASTGAFFLLHGACMEIGDLGKMTPR